MPRAAKRPPVVAVEPITAEDVAQIWQRAARSPPQFPGDVCKQIAELLTHHRVHRAGDQRGSQHHIREAESARALLRFISSHLDQTICTPALMVSREDAERLRAALRNVLPALDPKGTSGQAHAPVWEGAAVIAWLIARDALATVRRSAGTTRKSVAVRFAAAATERMGFAGVTSEAVAKRLARIPALRT